MVTQYKTGERLAGTPSDELVEQSLAASPTGAVNAYCDGSGVWQYVAQHDIGAPRFAGLEILTVYVE